MYYVIYTEDIENSLALRKASTTEHRQRLQTLRDEGRLLTAGPMPLIDADDISEGVSGSCIIAEFDSLSDAQKWAEQDPFVKTGVYQKVTVKPYKLVY